MYMVYWTIWEHEKTIPCNQAFPSDQMSAAMRFTEELRGRQRAGEPIRFVTLCSEHPDVVGAPGVAEPSADYNWKKRRR